jgi:hypothetical protein
MKLSIKLNTMRLKRTLVVILLTIVEAAGASVLISGIPLVFAKITYRPSIDIRLDLPYWSDIVVIASLFAILSLIAYITVSLIVYITVFRIIPAIIRANIRLANRVLRETHKIYCEKCSVKSGQLIYHLPPAHKYRGKAGR